MILCQYQIWPSVVIHPVIWWVMTRWLKAAKTKLISNFLSTFLLRQLQNYVFALDIYKQKTCSICKSDCMLLTGGNGTIAKLFAQQETNQSRGRKCTTQLLGTCWDFLIFGDIFFCCNALSRSKNSMPFVFVWTSAVSHSYNTAVDFQTFVKRHVHEGMNELHQFLGKLKIRWSSISSGNIVDNIDNAKVRSQIVCFHRHKCTYKTLLLWT